jgi:mono/diheme cytochrome c family protein
LKTSLLAVAACSVLFAIGALHAQTPSSEPEATLTTNPVYTKNCAKCHGKTAEGRHFAGPSLVSPKAVAMSADDLRNMIANGKGHMPKFAAKLKPEEIDTLVQQIQALNKK